MSTDKRSAFERAIASIEPDPRQPVSRNDGQMILRLQREREELIAELREIIDSAGLNPDNTAHARALLAGLDAGKDAPGT